MMKRTDCEVCADELREARRILSAYIESSQPRDALATIDQIIEVLLIRWKRR